MPAQLRRQKLENGALPAVLRHTEDALRLIHHIVVKASAAQFPAVERDDASLSVAARLGIPDDGAVDRDAPCGNDLSRLAARRDTRVTQDILQSFFHVLENYTKAHAPPAR